MTPNALTKQAAASAADRASIAPTAGTISLMPQDGTSGLSRIAWKVSHSETKPLSGGSAEIATHPVRNAKAVSGMRWMRPPRCSMSRSPVAVRTAPEPKNRRLLKRLWLKTWNSAAVSASAAAAGHVVRREGERETEADEDDADVLDRVIGEQPLDVVLHQGAEHAEQAGDAGERDDEDAPPPGRRAVEVEDDADEAVDGDLGHHPAHQRRDVAGRGRVGERQPDMQRHQARLRAGAEEDQDQDQSGERGGRAAHLGERVSAAAAGEQSEGEQQAERAEARHDDVDVAGAPVLGIAVMRHHQRPGRQRHELPGDEEREGVVGQHDEVHAGQKRRVERQHPAGRLLVRAVAEGKEARAGAAEIGHGEKERGERIDAEIRADPWQAERQPAATAGRAAPIEKVRAATRMTQADARHAP